MYFIVINVLDPSKICSKKCLDKIVDNKIIGIANRFDLVSIQNFGVLVRKNSSKHTTS